MELVEVVRTDVRQKAVALLVGVSAIRLTESQAVEFIGEERGSAKKAVGSAISRLEKRRDLALKRNVGSWNGILEGNLEDLRAISRDAPALQPVLSRAATYGEATGKFTVRMCGNDLMVSNVALAIADASALPLPIVVFLPRIPTKVYISAGVAR